MSNFRSMVLSSALALALISSLTGCGHELTPEEHIAKAKALIEKGEIRSASIELANAVEKNPKSVDGRWLRAKVALDMGDGATAEKEIKKALELGFSRSEAQPLLARAILQQGDLDRALKETEKILDLPTAKNKAMILAVRGQALVMKGRYDAAKTVLEEALQVDPNSSAALIGMTAMHAIKREFVEAQRWADMAVKAEPTSPDAWSAQGDIALAQNNPTKAEEAFGNAIKHRRIASLDTAKRALIRVQLKKFQEAEKDIEALQKDGLGKHPYVSYVTGQNFFAQKKFPQAAEAFEASQTLEPNNRLNNLYLAVTFHILGQKEKALALTKRLSTEAPRSSTVKQLLGDIQISRAEYDAANTTLQSALAAAPQNTHLLDMLASVALMQGDSAKGLEYASRLATLAPNSSEAKAQLMRAKLMAGQPLDASNPSTAPGDAFNTELLLTLEALRNKQPTAALARAKKLHALHPDKAAPLNLMAAAYLMQGQPDKAKMELEAALKIKPNDASATCNLARIEIFKRNMKRARDLLAPLVKEQPGNEEAVLLLVAVDSRLGKADTGIPLLEQLVQRNPDALSARNTLATEYLHMGKTQNVLAITQGLSDAQLKRQPTLLELRGKALMQTNDTISARKVFEQWTKLAPESASAQFYYSDSLARTGDLAAARSGLERAIKLNPRYLPARIGEVKMLVQNKQMDKAQKALTKLRQDFGDHSEVLGVEGWFALGTSNFGGAEKSLTAALKKKPDTDTAILLVRSLWGAKKHDQALRTMQDWLKTHPDDLDMRLHMAGAYLSLNRNEDARATYAKIVERYPNHVPALNNLAWLGQDKDLNQAIKHAQHAQTVAPRDAFVKDTLGMLMLKRGDLSAAQGLLQEAVSLMPAAPQFQLHLAQILLKQQRQPQAGKVLNELIKKAPASPQAKEAKALLDAMGGAK